VAQYSIRLELHQSSAFMIFSSVCLLQNDICPGIGILKGSAKRTVHHWSRLRMQLGNLIHFQWVMKLCSFVSFSVFLAC